MDYPILARASASDGPAMYRQALICPHCNRDIDLSIKRMDWSIRQPRDVATRLLAQTRGLEQERLYVLSLDTRNRVLDQTVLYVGNVSSTLVRVAEVFREPIRLNASGVIVCHTHPSNDATPSPDDLHLTAMLIAAGRMLDLPVLDHLVLAGDNYQSLRDRGVQFDR